MRKSKTKKVTEARPSHTNKGRKKPQSVQPAVFPVTGIHQQSLLRMQEQHGNAYVSQYLRHTTGTHLAREVAYNEDGEGCNISDPEQAAGVLPFTEDGWDGLAIGRRLTQLDPATPRFDESRCVETSFLVGLIQRGPDALKSMLNNYLARYRAGLRRASTAENIKRWYRHSIRLLTPMLDKIDDKTMTFADLAVILQEMYDVYGEGDTGTQWIVGNNMARREGYAVEVLNQDIFVQEDAATLAQELEPGEMLSCRVEGTREGTGAYGHAIHIGRHPQTNQLYLYDPLPVSGDQLIICGNDLSEVTHYFSNFSEEADETTGETETFEEMRTFNVYAKLTPPAEDVEME